MFSEFSLDSLISSTDPMIWKMNCLLTQLTVTFIQNPKAQTLLLHTCCCVCLQSQMFNSTSPDIVDSCCSSTVLIHILNRIGAIASNDTPTHSLGPFEF